MKRVLIVIGLFLVAFILVFIFDKDKDYIKVGNLYISEIVASNSYTHKNADLEFDDYIEIYNGNNYAVDLNNYRLTDSIYENKKWIFPDISIDAHEYLLIYASGKNKCEEKFTHNSDVLSHDTQRLQNLVQRYCFFLTNANFSV